jgi:radical SAM protein with 4Fe4S-binding SPASM domain
MQPGRPAPCARPFARWDQANRTLLLRPETGAWVVVEGAGAEIAELCDGVRSPEDIARCLSRTYDVDPTIAYRDVQQHLARLEAAGFFRAAEDGVHARAARATEGLEALSLHVTGRCTLECRHCYASETVEEPPIELLVSAARQARKLGARRFNLTGGDPLLRPEALEALAEPMAGVNVTVLTNGLAPAEELARLITERGWELQVSLDGARAETHDWYRGPGAHAQVAANLDALAVQGLTRSVTLSVCLSRVNRAEVEEIVQQALAWGIPRVHLARVSRHGRAVASWDQLSLPPEEWADTYRELARVHARYRDRLELTGFLADYLRGCLARPDTRGCRPGQQAMVDLQGRVYPCIMLGTPGMCLGNLTQEPLAACLARADGIRAVCAARLSDETVCGGCEWRMICRGACPGWPLVQDGTLMRTDDLCEVRGELFPGMIFELAQERAARPVPVTSAEVRAARYRFCDVEVRVRASREAAIEALDRAYRAFRSGGEEGAVRVECMLETDESGRGRAIVDGIATPLTVDDPESEYAGWVVFEAAAAASETHVFLHASSVVVEGRGVLFIGPAGRGKSTLARAMVAQGAEAHSDDVTPMERATGLAERFPKNEPNAEDWQGARAPVAAAFLLRPREGATQPDLEPCAPHEAAAVLAANAFGRTTRPAADLLWQAADALSEARFWWLRPGEPADTARAVRDALSGTQEGRTRGSAPTDGTPV